MATKSATAPAQPVHFVGSILSGNWAKVVSGELRIKAGVKPVVQRTRSKRVVKGRAAD